MDVIMMTMQSEALQGIACVNRSTKQLLRTSGLAQQIAVLAHEDIDEMAAEELIRARVKAIVNAAPSMTGAYPVNGAAMLLRAGIPIFEISPYQFACFKSGLPLTIRHSVIEVGRLTIPCTAFTHERVKELSEIAIGNLNHQLRQFVDNTLHHALVEKNELLQPLSLPYIATPIANKHVIVVVRGSGYREDLLALDSYITEYDPVLVGVDGGADAIIEYGYKPDMIIGDMDSVSDAALLSGCELVVHAYMDGTAPGLQRIQSLGLDAVIIRAKGISEDVAMLLVHELNASLIVAVGHHSHMTDFLMKGRHGMASTWLTRLKIGAKLIDAKGISKLFPHHAMAHGARRGYGGNESVYYYPSME